MKFAVPVTLTRNPNSHVSCSHSVTVDTPRSLSILPIEECNSGPDHKLVGFEASALKSLRSKLKHLPFLPFSSLPNLTSTLLFSMSLISKQSSVKASPDI